ncbi:hypothetical protein CMK11_21615 [Candidatus Poribacteria bacterium]|nr:hypothetical protein [Candidatus Poribacteria bacterium]
MGDTKARDAFDTAALAQVGAIRGIGRRRLAAARDLDDFTQEVLLRAYANCGQLREIERLPQWIQTIARHTAQDWNRKRKPELSEFLAELPSRAPSPHEHAENGERWRAFLDALHALSPVDRDLLYSHLVEGSPYDELEARHGLSHSAVGVRLHRARRRVRRRLRFLLSVGAALVGRRATASAGGILTMKWVYATAISAVCVCALVGGWLWRAAVDDEVSYAPRADTRGATPATGRSTHTRRAGAPTAERRTRASSSDTRAGSAAEDDALRARHASEPNEAADPAGGLVAGSGQSDTPEASPHTDAERQEQVLYVALAEMWPRYLNAVERSNAIQDTRPEEPGKQATEAEKEEWREKDAAFQAALQPVDAECWQYRDRLKEMFPEAIAHEVFRDDDGNQTGYTWRLHMDRMRQAVGGRLPSEG